VTLRSRAYFLRASSPRLQVDVKKVIDEEEDSIVFYLVRRQKYMERQVMVKEKGELSLIL